MFIRRGVRSTCMPTQADRRAATTAALLDAARRLFGERGYHAVSIDEIAAGAGVTRGALYHHFTGKDAVFETVLRSIHVELRDEVVAAVGSFPDRRDQLREGCREFVVRAARADRLQIMLIDGPSVLGWNRYREIDSEYFFDLILGAVAALSPDEPPDTNALVAHALLAACGEIAIRFGGGACGEEAVAHVLDRFVP